MPLPDNLLLQRFYSSSIFSRCIVIQYLAMTTSAQFFGQDPPHVYKLLGLNALI